jgi:hypothetical protein
LVTRDFDAMFAMRAGQRPTFRVGGQEFTVKAKLPNRKFKKLLAAFVDDEIDETQAEKDFFNLCLIKSDRERFFALLEYEGDDDEGDDVIDIPQLNELTSWLMEYYTGKAAENSSSSSDGSSGTGGSPKVVSLSSRQQASA